jgi:hypothetical protein
MITEHYWERDGDHLLFRLVVGGVAALDVLTDEAALRGATAMLRRRGDEELAEHRLGFFGPFDVVVSFTADGRVAIAVDGPELGRTFRGDQSMVLYVEREALLAALEAG